jgi:hypothetical protein
MSRGPKPKNFREKIAETWGATPPDWVVVLAEKCTALSQAAVAKALGRSASMISAVLAATYAQKGGDLGDIERRVRGLWMGEAVSCPAKGASISTTQCDATRRRRFSASSPAAIRLYHACRTCPNNPETGE